MFQYNLNDYFSYEFFQCIQLNDFFKNSSIQEIKCFNLYLSFNFYFSV